ncbi:MAG TPA: hypothetical protein VFI11_03740 [Anaerolineales bacterium]|nr:hypothetical protein [Anaerolineales bacterium]
MAKWLVVVLLVVVALGLVVGGAAFAAYQSSPRTAAFSPDFGWRAPWHMGGFGRGDAFRGPMMGGFGRGDAFRGPMMGGFGRGEVFPGPMMGGAWVQGETGVLHDYMFEAMAKALNLSAEELTTRLEAGDTLAEIAESQGLTLNDVARAHREAMSEAIQQAVDDGTLTQDQGEWMLDHMGSGLMPFGPMMWGRGFGMGWGSRDEQPSIP